MNYQRRGYFNFDPEKELEAVLGIMKFKKGGKEQHMSNEKIKKTPFQIKVLHELFKITQFPSTATRKDLALLLSIPARSIQVWFQNTRQARKKQKTGVESENSPPSVSEDENDDVSLITMIDIIVTAKKEMK